MNKKSKSNTLKPFEEDELIEKVSWKPDRIKVKMQYYLGLLEETDNMLKEHCSIKVGKLYEDLMKQKENLEYNIKVLKILMSEVDAEVMKELMLSDNQIDELGIPTHLNWKEKKEYLIKKSTEHMRKEFLAWYNKDDELKKLGVNDDNIEDVMNELAETYPKFWDKVGVKFGLMFDDRFRTIKANADKGYHKKSTKPKGSNPKIVERDAEIREKYSAMEKEEIKPEAIRRRLAKDYDVEPTTIKSIVSG